MGNNKFTIKDLEEMLEKAKKEDNTRRKAKTKEDAPFDRKVVIFVLITCLMVVATSFLVTYKTGVEASTTVATWFAFAGAEVWALAFLKNNKRKNEKRCEVRNEQD